MQPLSTKLPCDKSIVDLVKERVYFMYMKDKVLWYKTESGFIIKIPVDECNPGCPYNYEEPKAMVFLRWLRPQYGAAIRELNQKEPVTPNPEVKLLTVGTPPIPPFESVDDFQASHHWFD